MNGNGSWERKFKSVTPLNLIEIGLAFELYPVKLLKIINSLKEDCSILLRPKCSENPFRIDGRTRPFIIWNVLPDILSSHWNDDNVAVFFWRWALHIVHLMLAMLTCIREIVLFGGMNASSLSFAKQPYKSI